MHILNLAVLTLTFTLTLIPAISADGSGGCEAWSYSGTSATDSSSPLADDCTKVADLFQHEWDMDKKKTMLCVFCAREHRRCCQLTWNNHQELHRG